MDEKLDKIAAALEKQNELFQQWIDINRSCIEQNIKMRAEIFPVELEEMKQRVAFYKKAEA